MRDVSVVLIGHGSSSDPLATRSVRAAATTLRTRKLFGEIRVGFWKARPHLRDAVVRARGPVVLILPWLFSEGWFSRHVIPAALGLRGRVTRHEKQILVYADPVGTHPDMDGAVLRCAAAASRPGKRPPMSKTTLVVAGHGTSRDERSAEAVRSVVARLRRRRQYAAVVPAFLEQEPSAHRALHTVRTPFAVVVPFFAGDGPHSRRDLPRLMGLLRKDGRMPRNPIRSGESLNVWHARAIGTGPWMLPIALARAREALRRARGRRR